MVPKKKRGFNARLSKNTQIFQDVQSRFTLSAQFSLDENSLASLVFKSFNQQGSMTGLDYDSIHKLLFKNSRYQFLRKITETEDVFGNFLDHMNIVNQANLFLSITNMLVRRIID